MNNQPPVSNQSFQKFLQTSSPYDSVRELLDSLSKEQRRNQELIVSLSFSLRSFTNIDRFLELVPVVVSRLLGIDGALLVKFDSSGCISPEQIHSVPDSHSEVLRHLILEFKQGKIDGFGNNEVEIRALDQLIEAFVTHAEILATSLVVRGRTYGRLYGFSLKGSFSFSDIHRRHLQLVADLAGLAIENDCLLQQIRRHESVDRQLSIGAEIQSQLLPDECPIVEGIDLAACCRPALQVGGDYYDFMSTRPELTGMRRQRGRWSFVIGDVMGKGIPAGLLMTMLRGMLRAEVLSALPPDRILHDLNQLALDDLSQSHRFVTLFYSDYDPISKKLRFANAAHNPPLLWKADQKKISRLDALGLLIGLQSDAEYDCGEVVLEPGDVLLYYTDGVTEALGMTGDRFTEKRLIASLVQSVQEFSTAKEILNNLFKRLDSFVGDNLHLEDDASMVVMKIHNEINLPQVNYSEFSDKT